MRRFSIQRNRAFARHVTNISKNAGILDFDISQIRNHLFYNGYDLGDGVIAKFDAHPDIANGWGRLDTGAHTAGDLQLLQHDLLESKFKGIFRTDYATAHNAANRSGRPSGIN
jgi:hypothetical protein